MQQPAWPAGWPPTTAKPCGMCCAACDRIAAHLNCTPSLPRTRSTWGCAQQLISLTLRHSSVCQTRDSWRSPVLAWVGASASAWSGDVMLGCGGQGRGWWSMAGGLQMLGGVGPGR